MIDIQKTPLTEDVLQSLIAMSREWEGEDSCWGYRENAAEDIADEDIFLLRFDGALAGYLLCHRYVQEKSSAAVPQGSRCLEIEELYIVPAYRSQGLGQALYRAAVDHYAPDLDCVTLATATKNHRAILHFYIDELGMTFWNARLFQKIEQPEDS